MLDFRARPAPLVIAEIGNNHEGDVEVAERLVRAAAAAGADGVKFQTFRTEHFLDRSDGARFERYRRFELTIEQFARLAGVARDCGLLFLSTPLDLQSAEALVPIVDAFKIASGDNQFFPLMARVAASGKPVILSSGLLDLAGIAEAVRFVRSKAPREAQDAIAVLHCVSAYPVPPGEVNLSGVRVLADALDCVVGYSDHSLGIEACVLAVALGARIIEKHFTLSKTFSEFRDHQLSADPDEMRALVRRAREAAVLLGTGVKAPQPCEQPGTVAFRRSIAAARDLPAGHRLELSDLTWVRPGGGMVPGAESGVVGRTLGRAVAAGTRLDVSMLE